MSETCSLVCLGRSWRCGLKVCVSSLAPSPPGLVLYSASWTPWTKLLHSTRLFGHVSASEPCTESPETMSQTECFLSGVCSVLCQAMGKRTNIRRKASKANNLFLTQVRWLLIKHHIKVGLYHGRFSFTVLGWQDILKWQDNVYKWTSKVVRYWTLWLLFLLASKNNKDKTIEPGVVAHDWEPQYPGGWGRSIIKPETSADSTQWDQGHLSNRGRH